VYVYRYKCMSLYNYGLFPASESHCDRSSSIRVERSLPSSSSSRRRRTSRLMDFRIRSAEGPEKADPLCGSWIALPYPLVSS